MMAREEKNVYIPTILWSKQLKIIFHSFTRLLNVIYKYNHYSQNLPRYVIKWLRLFDKNDTEVGARKHDAWSTKFGIFIQATRIAYIHRRPANVRVEVWAHFSVFQKEWNEKRKDKCKDYNLGLRDFCELWRRYGGWGHKSLTHCDFFIIFASQ